MPITPSLRKGHKANYLGDGMKAKSGETPHVKREFVLNRTTEDCLFEVVRALSRGTGTSVSNSHFLRALLKALSRALPEIERQAEKIGKLKRPPNAKDNQAEHEEFEEQLARCLHLALRAVKPKQ